MFHLGTAASDGVEVGLDVGQLGPRARDVHFVDQAGLVASLLEAHGVAMQGNGRFHHKLFVVEGTEEVVIARDVGGEQREHDLQVGSCGPELRDGVFVHAVQWRIEHLHLATIRAQRSGDDTQKRRFAATGRADQPEQLAHAAILFIVSS